jgi:DNA invertase Pin-like site-specific DNA recombinase
MMTLREILKGKIPVIYLRVSSQAQKQRGTGTVSQKKMINDWLKLNKITRKPIEFKDVGRGGNESSERKGWKALLAFLKKQKDPNKYFVIVRDFKRWSRHVVYGPEAFAWLYRNGVEIVSVADNISTGSIERPDAQGEFIFGLWMALGSQERTGGSVSIKGGVDRARADLGVIGGQPLDITGQYRELLEQEKGLRAGYVSWAGFGRTLKPKRGRSWMINTLDKYDRIRKYGKENNISRPLEKWLNVIDKNKSIVEQHGKKSKKWLAVQRMTSGFVKKPTEFWKFRPTDEIYDEWVKNADEYQASKGR